MFFKIEFFSRDISFDGKRRKNEKQHFFALPAHRLCVCVCASAAISIVFIYQRGYYAEEKKIISRCELL